MTEQEKQKLVDEIEERLLSKMKGTVIDLKYVQFQ